MPYLFNTPYLCTYQHSFIVVGTGDLPLYFSPSHTRPHQHTISMHLSKHHINTTIIILSIHPLPPSPPTLSPTLYHPLNTPFPPRFPAIQPKTWFCIPEKPAVVSSTSTGSSKGNCNWSIRPTSKTSHWRCVNFKGSYWWEWGKVCDYTIWENGNF